MQEVTDKAGQELDTLDAEGNLIGMRLRKDVHGKGFWHRYVHIWLLNLPDEAVLMQRRAATKHFGNMWNCCSGHITRGEPSLQAAQTAVQSELGLYYAETEFDFVFTCKEETKEAEKTYQQVIDVYVISLLSPPDIARIHVDLQEAGDLRYVPLTELEQVYEKRPPDFVVATNPSYAQRLFRAFNQKIKQYIEDLPNIDSDEERHNKKSEQLLDTLPTSSVQGLRDGANLQVLGEPCKRGDIYKQSIWHRGVHVWVMDVLSGVVLILQRARKKRHFGGRWYCSSGHVKEGESSLPTAVKSITDDVGLTRFKEEDFEFLFQVKNVVDTGGGCRLKQVVDVFCVVVPSLSSYPDPPPVESMKLEKGEVDNVQYIRIEDLQQAWACGDPQFVIPEGKEYSQRLFFLLTRKCKSHQGSVAIHDGRE